MGGSSSKNQGAKSKLVNSYSQSGAKGYLYEGQHQQQRHELQKQSMMITPPQSRESKDKENQEPGTQQSMQSRFGGYSSSEEEFYDGIPRFHGSSSRKPKPRRVAKVDKDL